MGESSRIITGKLQLNLTKTEIFPFLVAAADVVRPAVESKGVRLVVDIDPSVGATMIDGDMIQQVVWNLLTNAVRFTPRGGRVTLTCDRSGADIPAIALTAYARATSTLPRVPDSKSTW